MKAALQSFLNEPYYFSAIYFILSLTVRLEAAHGYSNNRVTKINVKPQKRHVISTKSRETAKEGHVTAGAHVVRFYELQFEF